jgi:hypothetical protein
MISYAAACFHVCMELRSIDEQIDQIKLSNWSFKPSLILVQMRITKCIHIGGLIEMLSSVGTDDGSSTWTYNLRRRHKICSSDLLTHQLLLSSVSSHLYCYKNFLKEEEPGIYS